MIVVILTLFSALQFTVSDIVITGNQYFKDKTIKQLMLTQTSGVFRRGRFVNDIFSGDITAIQDYYISNGFIDARVSYELVFDSITAKVAIEIVIDEGTQYSVHGIVFTGNSVIGSDVLKDRMITRLNEPFDKRKMEYDSYIITTLYDDQGYADAQVNSNYTITDNQITITQSISEGEKKFIGDIEFLGLERTRRDVMTQEITLKRDDVFRYAELLKSQRNLYNLGIFRSIRINTKGAEGSNYKTIQFLLTEKKPLLINTRIGYGTQDYLRLGLGITYINMFGRAWRGELNGKASFAEYQLNSQLTFPRFFIFPIKYSIGAFYQSKEEIGFKIRRIGGYLTTAFNVGGGKFLTKYNIENLRTYYSDGDSSVDNLLQGVTMSWLRDRRNDPFFPHRGDYINLSIETSGIIVPADVNYVRPIAEYRLFKHLMSIVGAVSAKIGMIQVVAPTIDVPVYKRFYCGGASSVRGYDEWSIGPKDGEGNPLGGKALCEISGEIRIPIYRRFGGALFIDGGNIWQKFDDVNTTLRWGVGAGLRVITPLGSIRLDYGIKINRQKDESAGALHFAIGEAF